MCVCMSLSLLLDIAILDVENVDDVFFLFYYTLDGCLEYICVRILCSFTPWAREFRSLAEHIGCYIFCYILSLIRVCVRDFARELAFGFLFLNEKFAFFFSYAPFSLSPDRVYVCHIPYNWPPVHLWLYYYAAQRRFRRGPSSCSSCPYRRRFWKRKNLPCKV